MVKIDQLTQHEPSQAQALDLCSTHTDKIRKIQHLHRFRNLRSLNLSNNMIVKLENLNHLTQLRILKLDFNQITTIEDLKTLTLLEELSLSYNRICSVPGEIKCNQKIKVFHLAYNDIKSIEDIKHLSQLSALSILSLAGNPFLNALNYIAFIKMLIPSLLILDSRDASESVINANVYPHQQIFILRDALNKLIDQRNSMLQPQNQQEEDSPIPQRSMPQATPQISHETRQMQHKHSFGKTVSFAQNEREKVLEVLQEWIESNSAKLQVKKIEINEISDAFSKRVNTTLKNQIEDHYQYLQQKVSKYHESDRKGKLTADKKQKLQKMEKQLKKVEIFEQQKREESRRILQTIKSKQTQYSKLKQKSHLLRSLEQKIRQNPSHDPHKLLLAQILYGQTTYQLNYKDMKKYLFYPKGVTHIIKNLNLLVFGELADYQRIQKLKQFLEQRSLIQIINNLKEMGVNYKKEIKKMQKQKAKIVQKLQTQALQLCDEWKQIQREKRNIRKSRQVSQSGGGQDTYDDQYERLEVEQRDRIMQLKREKQHYQIKVQQLQKSVESLQIEFQRKYKELQQFEKFFQQFKSDKEIAEGLKSELEDTQREINNKQQILMQIDQNVKELTLKEQNLQERAAHYERKAFQKSEQAAHYDQKLKTLNDKLRRATEEINSKSFELVRIQQQFTKLIEENRDYQKKNQRHKHTYGLYEQKLKNLNEIQASKKNTLTSIQNEIEVQKKVLKQLKQKVEQSQQKLNRNMEVSYQYQLKIQQGKKSIESLSDINRTLSDMMERQNQLKRSNLELQLQNQHLFELKGKLLEQIKVRYDDQDQTL